MIETSVHATGEIERDVLVAAAVVDTLSVLVLQLERLSAEVHLAEAFARADKALVRLAAERDGGALGSVCCRSTATYKTKGQGIVARRREVVVTEGDGFLLITVRIEGDVGGGLRRWQQVAPVVQLRNTEVDGAHLLPVGGNDIATYVT